MDVRQLSDLYEIQRLKARYFRLMDTKQWDEFRDVFTDDFVMFVENTILPEATEPTFTSADHLVAYLSASHAGKQTVHHGHMPEIEFLDTDEASGIWSMFDWVDDPGRGGAWQGYGHYHERYVRCADGKWRICSGRLTRLRVSEVPPQPSNVRSGVDADQLKSVSDGEHGSDCA